MRALLEGLYAVAVVVALGDSTAFAQARTRPGSERGGRMSYDGSYAMLGPTLALVVDRAQGNGASLGGEASLVGVRDALWAGGYADAAYAFTAEETRLSLGPEAGIRFLGIDAGYVLKLGGEHGTQHGFAIRPMLTLGIVTAYFRATWLTGEHADWLGELGIMLKAPLLLGNEAWF